MFQGDRGCMYIESLSINQLQLQLSMDIKYWTYLKCNKSIQFWTCLTCRNIAHNSIVHPTCNRLMKITQFVARTQRAIDVYILHVFL